MVRFLPSLRLGTTYRAIIRILMKILYWSLASITALFIITSLTRTSNVKAFQSETQVPETTAALETLISTENPTPTPPVQSTDFYTPTLTLEPTITYTPTLTTPPTSTPTPNPTVEGLEAASTAEALTTNSIYLPFILRQDAPEPPPYTSPVKILYCDKLSSPKSIPDNNEAGINDTISISDQRKIVDIDARLDISHTWVGDLNVELTHIEVNQSVKLINRPGRSGSGLGCGNDNIKAILDDEISLPVENECSVSPAAISGIYIPNQPMSWFDGDSVAGQWRLNVSDRSSASTGNLNGWCILATISENPEPPTPTPPPPDVPASAIINGVTGKVQSLPLDCESRSAVDWAKYFGVTIDELDFFHLLPHSDNPDKGFVGSVYGEWGQIPPNPYGVHAEPVAEVLRDHGLQAYAQRPLSWPKLRSEIAAGRPVIVWIIGSVNNGIPIFYTPSDGLHTIVARYEHTVIVTGYNSSSVYYLNGGTIYSKTIDQFLDSWSALGNMAITARP